MTQDISKMAEERYPYPNKANYVTAAYNYEVHRINIKREAWASGYTAALTSPASGWVRVESKKDLPERRTDIVTEWIDVNHSNPVWLIRRCDHTFIKWLFQQGRTIRYLSETPLPSVEECMEYAKGLSSVFWGSKDELKLFIEYAQTGLKQL